MKGKAKFPHLLSPIDLGGGLKLKNRIVKTPQSTWYWNEDGTANDRVINFYETIAKGGAALITIGAIYWDRPLPGGIYGGLYEDKFIEPMKKLVQAVQKHDCKVMCQLLHLGPSAPANYDGSAPMGPSALGVDELPSPPPNLVPTREITIAEIQEQNRLYIEAAKRAKECGFDGIELHFAHGYFYESFLTKVWNKRTDEYGTQNWENRGRLIREVVRGVKAALGKEYPLGVRMNGREWNAKDAMTIEDAVEVAKIFEQEGVNYLSVAGYGYDALPFRYLPDYFPYPEPDESMKEYMKDYEGDGLFVPAAAIIKQAVKIPVITVGRMDEVKGERLLSEGKADIIGYGRYLWADPYFPQKVMEDRCEDIMRCNRCATCEDPMVGPRRCRANPSMGREAELEIKPTDKPKKIMVIGGGPAGMEAARVAALRGHDVTIFEQKAGLGGHLPLASMIKGNKIEDVMPVITFLQTQIDKFHIKVKTGIKVTADTVKDFKPDAVIVATGGKYKLPNIKGIDKSIVSGVESLSKQVKFPLKVFGPAKLEKLTHLYMPTGKNVVIIGGQIEGCQGAAFMRKRGRNVTILEESDTIAKGIPYRYSSRLLAWFEKKNVQVLKGVKIEEITDNGVILRNSEGYRYLKEADSVMVLKSQEPNEELFNEVKLLVKEAYLIGSALGASKGSLIVDALRTGREIGVRI